jgi:lactoylglutathione lyase
MNLVKACLDVGMFTENLDAQNEFWTSVVGLPAEKMLKLGDGIHQHRFLVGKSVVKVNNSRRSIGDASSGISDVSLRRTAHTGTTLLVSPDKQQVTLEATLSGQEDGLIIRMNVSDVERHLAFWSSVMQFPLTDSGCVCGSTFIELRPRPQRCRTQSWKARGWSYMTVQVRDCAAEHEAALRRGATEGEPPRRIGDSAVISFIRDPDGNFIEISQKAELVGSLDAQFDPQ